MQLNSILTLISSEFMLIGAMIIVLEVSGRVDSGKRASLGVALSRYNQKLRFVGESSDSRIAVSLVRACGRGSPLVCHITEERHFSGGKLISPKLCISRGKFESGSQIVA